MYFWGLASFTQRRVCETRPRWADNREFFLLLSGIPLYACATIH